MGDKIEDFIPHAPIDIGLSKLSIIMDIFDVLCFLT